MSVFLKYYLPMPRECGEVDERRIKTKVRIKRLHLHMRRTMIWPLFMKSY